MKTKNCLVIAALGMLAVVPCFTACTSDADGNLYGLSDVGEYSMKMTVTAPSNATDFFGRDVDSRYPALINTISNILSSKEFDEQFANRGTALEIYRSHIDDAKANCMTLLDSLVGVTGSDDVYISCWMKKDSKNEYYPDASKFLSHDTIRPSVTVESLNLISVYECYTTNAVQEKSLDDVYSLKTHVEDRCSKNVRYFRENSIQQGFDKFCDSVRTYKYVSDYMKKMPDSVYIELQFRDESRTSSTGNVIKRANGTELRKRYYKSDF